MVAEDMITCQRITILGEATQPPLIIPNTQLQREEAAGLDPDMAIPTLLTGGHQHTQILLINILNILVTATPTPITLEVATPMHHILDIRHTLVTTRVYPIHPRGSIIQAIRLILTHKVALLTIVLHFPLHSLLHGLGDHHQARVPLHHQEAFLVLQEEVIQLEGGVPGRQVHDLQAVEEEGAVRADLTLIAIVDAIVRIKRQNCLCCIHYFDFPFRKEKSNHYDFCVFLFSS
jgi:hypothetical protein